MSAEIERGLIGAVLNRPSLFDEVPVSSDHFAAERHAKAWQTIAAMRSEGEGVDPTTVMDRLATEGDRQLSADVIGWSADAPGPSMAAEYARRVVEAWRLRSAREIAANLDEACIRGERSSIDRAIRDLMDLDQSSSSHEHTIQDAARAAMDDMAEAADAKGGLRGITTGLKVLDSHLGGWQRGDLTVIGARPAMGKTALLLHFAASAGVPVGFASAEQPAFQIAQRHAASIGRVSLSDLRQGKVGDREQSLLVEAIRRINRMDYRIYDRPSPHISDVERVARRWKQKGGLGILLVDYIQRIRGDGDKKHERVGDVVQRLKTLARDLDVPVVALSQVGRQVEQRANRRPGMGDLSDSSEIEKESDAVITLYRDEVYNPETKDGGIAELYIAKNRHGYTGTVRVQWAGAFVSFADLARGAE